MLDRALMVKVTTAGGAAGNVCVKCGAADPGKRWHDASSACAGRAQDFSGVEHMHMSCQICGYEWPTGPLDAA